MRRKPGTLAKIDGKSIDSMLASMGNDSQAEFNRAVDELLYPGRKQVRAMTDEELATLIARGTPADLAKLAESEVRTREAWRGPAKWSFIVAVFSLIVAALALAVSFAAFTRPV